MIRSELIVDDDVLEAVQDALKRAPETIRRTVNKIVLPKVRDRARVVLSVMPGRPHYPLAWTSERQRRFVMAKLRRENNLPYQRTGRMVAAWRTETAPIDAGIAIMISNNSPAAPYVVGNRQQRYHRQTGWYQVDDKVLELSEYTTNELIDVYGSILGFESVLP